MVILILLTLFCLTLFGVFLFFWGYSTARYRQSVKDRETARLVGNFKEQYDAMENLARQAIEKLPSEPDYGSINIPMPPMSVDEDWPEIIGK